jgi:large subunit ribosomal protein L22
MNQAKAKLRHLRMGPRKVRLVVDLIRSKRVDEALNQLRFSRKHATRPIKKLLESAIANAIHNHELKEDTLVVKEAFVDEGKTLYRWMPRAFGRATPIRKRMSHITLILEGEKVEKTEKTKTEEKTSKKLEKKTKEDTLVTKKVEEKKEKKVEAKNTQEKN